MGAELKRERSRLGVDLPEAAVAEIARYCKAHPRSPSAVREPRVMYRGGLFIALLGSTLDDGIAGMGNSVEAALRTFDVQYLKTLRPPNETGDGAKG